MKKAVECNECGRPTNQPRKGMCSGCYQAEYHGRTKEAECECCDYADPRVLVRRRDPNGVWLTLCANCVQIKGKRPMNLEELKKEVLPPDDRRLVDRRKGIKRRHDDRRDDDRRLLHRNDDDDDRRDDDRRRTEKRSVGTSKVEGN